MAGFNYDRLVKSSIMSPLIKSNPIKVRIVDPKLMYKGNEVMPN